MEYRPSNFRLNLLIDIFSAIKKFTMKYLKYIGVIILVVLIGLILTNPTDGDFKKHLLLKEGNKLQKEIEKGYWKYGKETNYFIMSTYVLDKHYTKERFIGIAGNFFDK